MAKRLQAMGTPGYEDGFKLVVLPNRLDEPLRRKKPTVYFVNSMSDLLHKNVSDGYIDQVFDVISRCPHHTFQVLTKRAERLAAYFQNRIPPGNAWIGVSVENRKYGLPRIEPRFENYIVRSLVDYNDISYDDHADLLYDLASQTVRHFASYLKLDEVCDVVRCHQREIARFIHAQMQEHYWEDVAGYEVKISKGFTELKPSAYTYSVQEPVADYRVSPADKSNMTKYLFGGFQKCLYPVQKFQSDAERKLAVILDREAEKWFKPAKGQFQIYYKQGADHPEYQPDFIAEMADCIYMLEPKAKNEMEDPVVLAKRGVAERWCKQASDHAATCGGKSWKYALIPHDAIVENMTLKGLAGQFSKK